MRARAGAFLPGPYLFPKTASLAAGSCFNAVSMSGESRENSRPKRRSSIVRRVVYAVLIVLLLPFVLVPLYAVVPPVSTLMLWRWVTFQRVERVWTPLADISPALVGMVIAGEDGRFCTHRGVDWHELQGVIEDYEEYGEARGASTVPMQVAKNLFLWPGRHVVRKALEIPLAYYMTAIWSKRRMIEVYLNIAEWGPDGEFGAEAAARRAFNKSASELTASEAALLAGALPNPLVRDPRRPGPQLRKAAGARQRIALNNGPSSVSCVISRR